jgi:hypothetical protein
MLRAAGFAAGASDQAEEAQQAGLSARETAQKLRLQSLPQTELVFIGLIEPDSGELHRTCTRCNVTIHAEA